MDVTCESDSDLCHFDAKQAFAQSNLKEDILKCLSEGYESLPGKSVGPKCNLGEPKKALSYNMDV